MEEDESGDGSAAALSPQYLSSDFSEDSTQGARQNFLRMIEEDVVVDEFGNLTIGGVSTASRQREIAEESPASSSSNGNSVEAMRRVTRQSEKSSVFKEPASIKLAGMDLESSNGESGNPLEISEWNTIADDAADFGGSDRMRKRSVTRSPDSMGASQRIEDSDDDLEDSSTAGNMGSSRKKLRQKSEGESGIDNLFEAVKDGNVSASRIVAVWLEKYKDKRYEGALDIIQFLVYSTGSVFKLTEDMLSTINAHSTKIDLFEEIANNSDEEALYPLVRKDKQWQNFARNFNNFMKKWTCDCVEMLACDGDFTDKLLFVIIPLTKSRHRALRHTATIAALHFGGALVRYIEELRQKIQDAEHQLEHENKKPKGTVSRDRIYALEVCLDSLSSSYDKASAKLCVIVKNVFNERYRDTCPGIRSACIRVFGNWMKVSSMRVKKENLFYLSLMLRDEMPEVRKACIEALLELYENHNLKKNLSEFTQTSKGKILALAVDNDLEVAELGVMLVSAVQRMYNGMFSPEESSVVYSLMFAEGRNLAVAAASFFTASYGEFRVSAGSSDSSRSDSQSAVSRILAIARYIVTSDATSEEVPFLVDALYSTERSIQNWEAIGNLLMESQDHNLTQEEEGVLILLLRYSAERHSGVTPVGRFPTNKRILPSAAAKVSALQAELTEAMLPVLPTLLSRFLIDPKKVMHLLTVPQFFESRTMAKATHKGSVKGLVNSVGDIIERIDVPEILESCGKCLALVAAVEGLTEVKGYETAVTERVWNNFDKSMSLYISTLQIGAGRACNDTKANMVIALKKLSVISSFINFESYKPWEIVCRLVKRVFRSNLVMSTEVIQSAVAVLYHSVLWGLKHIRQAHEDAQLGNEEDRNRMILDFKHKVSLIANLLNKFLKPGFEEIVCEAGSDVFQMLCDLMALFSSSAKPIRGIEPPIMDREEAIIESMLAVIQSYVLETDDPTDDSEERCFLLSLFCKLLVTQSVKPSLAGGIFKYYDKVGSKLVSILKATLIELRSKCQPELAKLMLSSLSLHLQDSLDSSSPDGIESTLKLARNFASILGPDASKYSDTLITLHEEGIALATENEDASQVPKMISLLEVLVEFSYKLSVEGRAQIRDKLKSILPDEAMEQDREDDKWKSVIEYVESLGDDEGESSRPRRSSRARSGTSGRSRRTTRQSRRVGNTTLESH